MDIKKLCVATLARQLSECDQSAEIVMVMGSIPVSIPVSSIAIRQNGNNEEVVALNVDHDVLVQMLDLGEQILKGSNNE